MENIPDYKYVNVLVNEKHLGTRTFSYLVSEQLKKKVKIGQAVIVPFGANKVESAFVVGFSNYLEDGITAKYIIDILDEVPLFDLKYLEFLNWVADYYFCSIQDVFQAAFPLQFLKQPKKFLIRLEEPQETVLSCEEQLLLNFFGCEKKVLYNTLLKRSKLSLQKFSSDIFLSTT